MPVTEPSTGTLTKADLVDRIHSDVGYSKKEAAELVETVFEVMKQSLERGDKIKISGFGNFEVKQKSPRKGRNPQTSEAITITGRKVLSFRTSQVLRDAINDAE